MKKEESFIKYTMKKKIDNPPPASTFAIHTSQPHNPKIAKELASLPD